MNIGKRLIVISAMILAASVLTAGQNSEGAKIDDLQKRIVELEAQIKQISQEMEKLKPKPSSQVPYGGQEAAKTSNTSETKPTESKQVESGKGKPIGIDVGSARITPYGTIFFNAFGNSGGTNNTDVPMWATTGPSNASASVRQTRLGFKLEGAKVGRARLSAVIEADFFGGFPGIGVGENFGVVRVRLANARLDWEKTSVTAGQDWMVFAPQNPTSIAAAAIPQLAAAGNNWARLPQVKVEHRFNTNITWQAAVLAPQTGDSATTASFLQQPNSGSLSRTPFFQSRIAFGDKNWLGTKKPGTVGFSGHYGRSRVFTGVNSVENNVDSIGFALDWNFPLAKRVGLVGEVFAGRNLGGFQSGIFQSYNPDSAYRVGGQLVAGGVRSIGTRGGWLQLGFVPDLAKDRLSLNASIGIDDPRNNDLLSLSLRDWRTRNLAVAFNSIYKITPQFSIAAEIRSFRTNYFYSGRKLSTHLNLSAAYSF